MDLLALDHATRRVLVGLHQGAQVFRVEPLGSDSGSHEIENITVI